MIFVGDIALPDDVLVQNTNVPRFMKGKAWFGNLEGTLVKNGTHLKDSKVVFNDFETISRLKEQINIAGFSLANNHIFDAGDFVETSGNLNELQIPFCGAGSDLNSAKKELRFFENGVEIVILSFGWEVIQCHVATESSPGVNPLTKQNVLRSVMDNVKKFPSSKVIVYMHWGYELEDTPQPFERELAREIIDNGACAVVGCHPHRISGFELYKGRPIVYSLGNWMFLENFYHGGKVSFPSFCSTELALEMDFAHDEIYFHFFETYDEGTKLRFIKSEGIDSIKMKEYTPFRNLTNVEYIKWYKNNHYHRGKFLPIYYSKDTELTRIVKNRINKVRDWLIKVYINFKSYM